MPKALPYFRWYTADAETDDFYMSLSCAEGWLYHRCLNVSWQNGGIPANPDVLASIVRIPRDEFDRAWPKVKQRFVPSESDSAKLVNPRLEEERKYAMSKSSQAAAAAAVRHGHADAMRPHCNDHGNASGERRAYDSVCDSKTLPFVNKSKTEVKPKKEAGQRFEEWIEPYRRVASRQMALQMYLSVVTVENEDAAFACRDRYLASDEVSRNVFMEAHNFLQTQSRENWEGKWPAANLAHKPAQLSPTEKARKTWEEQERAKRAKA